MKWTLKARVIDYILGTGVVHLYLWAVLTPWFFTLMAFTWEQYETWVWQAPIIALIINYPMVLLLLWLTPKWRKRIGAPKVCDKCGR